MRADITSRWVTAQVSAAPGEVVAVVGPNGAGKSSLLRALAGLQPATGSLELAGRDVVDVDADGRRIGWMPQQGVLFEHLSVVDNVAYGLRCRGQRRAPARATAMSWLDRLGVADLARRRPRELSGGQVAKVALARAAAPEPDLLLLDEPLAALDSASRDDVRRLLRVTLSGGNAPVLVVTHDPVDVVALADRIVVLEGGRVVQDDTPAAVAAAPRTAWVAGLLGQNAWRGTTDDTGLLVDGGGHITAAEPLAPGRPALAMVEPAAVTLHRRPPQGSARTVVAGDIAEVRALGGRVRVVVAGVPRVTAEVTVAAAADLGLADGGTVYAGIKATGVRMVDV